MILRQATPNDLASLCDFYKAVTAHMDANGIHIWDDVYPCCVLADDINADSLYILDDNGVIAAAFALGEKNDGEAAITWHIESKKPMYIVRLAVNNDYLNCGIGADMMTAAEKAAKEKGADTLRLLVGIMNTPAINLYIKCGYTKADGIYNTPIDENDFLPEYGYEKQLI